MLINPLSYKISIKLRKTLEMACSKLQDFRDRVAKQYNKSHPNHDIDFQVATRISVQYFDDDTKRPIFELSEFHAITKNRSPFDTGKRLDAQNLRNIAEVVCMQMEDEQLIPVTSECKLKIVILKNFKQTEKYYCLAEEAKELKRKALESFEKAETWTIS